MASEIGPGLPGVKGEWADEAEGGDPGDVGHGAGSQGPSDLPTLKIFPYKGKPLWEPTPAQKLFYNEGELAVLQAEKEAQIKKEMVEAYHVASTPYGPIQDYMTKWYQMQELVKEKEKLEIQAKIAKAKTAPLTQEEKNEIIDHTLKTYFEGVVAPVAVYDKLLDDSMDWGKAMPMTYDPMGVHYTSNKNDWGTPWDFFWWLDAMFHFTLDVCATIDNTKCADFLTPEINAKEVDWWGRVWMNPPYSEVGEWLDEMGSAIQTGEIDLGVALVAARPDTQWWWNAIKLAKEVWFLKGRLQFEGAMHTAPFPSAVLVFQPTQIAFPPRVRFVNWKGDEWWPKAPAIWDLEP